MKKYFLLLNLIVLSISFILQSCKEESTNEKELRNVLVTTPKSLTAETVTNYSGIVEEGASVSAAFMAEGKINKILVKEGDRVRKGQLLATLDDSDYRIGVTQLETQFNQMTKEKERMDAMFERHNISPNDYEKFEAGYKQLKLQLEMAGRNLEYTKLYSPVNGYVATKYMNEGELVGGGTPLFNIVDDTSLIASADLPVDVYLEKDKIKSAKGRIPGFSEEIPLNIISFTPSPENNMLYHMKLSVPISISKELSPGMNIAVLIETNDNNDGEYEIPSRAIISEDSKTYVWIFNDNDSTIHKKEINIKGSPKGKMSRVIGLDLDSKIVEVGVKQLYSGEKVNILNREDLGL